MRSLYKIDPSALSHQIRHLYAAANTAADKQNLEAADHQSLSAYYIARGAAALHVFRLEPDSLDQVIADLRA